jgi:leucyl-tRNA synthetase
MSDGAAARTPPRPGRHAETEAKWQAAWAADGLFSRPRPDRPKWYIMELPPFATGSLHLGHARNYVLADAGARFRRMAGYDVLYTTGYDTFGLPSEIAAREKGVHPAELVDRCCAQMGAQLRRLGLSHDAGKITAFHIPEYYRWVQWVFLRLLEAGHCERREEPVLWCPACDASLTESLAEGGRCWRCGARVELRPVPQWFVKETHFAEDMLDGMAGLEGWPGHVIGIHKDWIGRREGRTVSLEVDGAPGESVEVFVETGASLAAAAAIGAAADHPLLAGREAPPLLRHPALARPLPLVAVPPQHLPGPRLAVPLVPGANPAHDRALAAAGVALIAAGGEEPDGAPAIVYRLHDWGIARQRYWGPPVPVIHCAACGPVPVPDADLPVLLPLDIALDTPGNPLETDPGFLAAPCPRCAAPARRDSDTFEAYSSPWWYHWACMQPGDASPFEAATAARWLPVDLMIGGADQIRSCFFHVRMIAKALKSLGISDVDEPVETLVAIGMVQADGRKMSKSEGNSVALDALLDAHGADAVRLAVLRGAAPDRDFNWSASLLDRARTFLAAVARFSRGDLLRPGDGAPVAGAAPGRLAQKLAGWTETAAHKITANLVRHDYHLMVQNLEFLFDRLRQFERDGGARNDADRERLRAAWDTFLRLLAPAAPHLAEELWAAAGGDGLVSAAPWPAPIEAREAPRRPRRHRGAAAEPEAAVRAA